jgi:hypothetical protein
VIVDATAERAIVAEQIAHLVDGSGDARQQGRHTHVDIGLPALERNRRVFVSSMRVFVSSMRALVSPKRAFVSSRRP